MNTKSFTWLIEKEVEILLKSEEPLNLQFKVMIFHPTEKSWEIFMRAKYEASDVFLFGTILRFKQGIDSLKAIYIDRSNPNYAWFHFNVRHSGLTQIIYKEK